MVHSYSEINPFDRLATELLISENPSIAEQRYYRYKLPFLQLKFDAGPIFSSVSDRAIATVFCPGRKPPSTSNFAAGIRITQGCGFGKGRFSNLDIGDKITISIKALGPRPDRQTLSILPIAFTP